MIEKHQPAGGVGSSDHGVGPKVLLCGPPPMMTAMKWVVARVLFQAGRGKLIRRGHLKELGYPAPRSVSKLEDQVFLF
jgi:cytochrome-b5 reductase